MRSLASGLVAFALLALATLAGCADKSAPALVEKGRQELASKNFSAASIQLKAALQIDPQAPEARYLLGLTLLEEGNPGAAATELQKAAELNHDKAVVLPALARAWLASGQYKRVVNEYEKTVLAAPRPSAELKASVAHAWAALGERERSESAVAEALRMDPACAPALVLQTRQVAASGRFDEALRMVQDLLARDPTQHEAWFLKGELLQLAKQDGAGALASYQRALVEQKAYFPAHRAIINMMLRQGDAAGVEAQVLKLKAAAPTHAQTTFAEAQLAFMKSDYRRAKQHVQAILKAAPDNSSALHLAGALEFQDGSMLIAKNHLTKALQSNPRLQSARRLLARVELRMGQSAAALAVLQPILASPLPDPKAAAIAGDAELQRGHPAAAEAFFAKAVASVPDDPRYRTAVAVSQLARGGGDAALAELQSIASKDKGVVADLALISARLQRGEMASALSAADALVGKQAQSPDALATRGRIHARMKNLAKSREDFERALTLDPKYFPAALALAEADVAEGKPQSARKRFEKQLEADPGNYMASLALADLTAKAGGSLEDVVQTLAEGIKQSPAAVPLRVALVNAYLSKRIASRALESAQQANASLPGRPEIVEVLGHAQLASGDAQQALSSYRQLANLNPRSAEPHLRLANTYLTIGDRASAERSLRAALDLDPKSEIAQKRLMQLALADKRPQDALAVARAMQKQDPKNPAGYIFESDLLLKQKDTKGAKSALRAGLKSTDSSLIAQRLHMHLRAGGAPQEAAQFAADWERNKPADAAFDVYMSHVDIGAGDQAQAEKRLRRVIAALPSHADALNNLSWLLIKRGDKQALDLARRANDAAPGQPAYMDTLAMALAADGQVKPALELQRKAVEAAPEMPVLRLNLARMALQAGDKKLARDELEKLAKLGDRFASQPEVAKLMQSL